MTFDIEGARKEGYDDSEIAQFLSKDNKFNYESARKEGYEDNEIIKHLVTQKPEDEGFFGGLKTVWEYGIKPAAEELPSILMRKKPSGMIDESAFKALPEERKDAILAGMLQKGKELRESKDYDELEQLRMEKFFNRDSQFALDKYPKLSTEQKDNALIAFAKGAEKGFIESSATFNEKLADVFFAYPREIAEKTLDAKTSKENIALQAEDWLRKASQAQYAKARGLTPKTEGLVDTLSGWMGEFITALPGGVVNFFADVSPVGWIQGFYKEGVPGLLKNVAMSGVMLTGFEAAAGLPVARRVAAFGGAAIPESPIAQKIASGQPIEEWDIKETGKQIAVQSLIGLLISGRPKYEKETNELRARVAEDALWQGNYKYAGELLDEILTKDKGAIISVMEGIRERQKEVDEAREEYGKILFGIKSRETQLAEFKKVEEEMEAPKPTYTIPAAPVEKKPVEEKITEEVKPITKEEVGVPQSEQLAFAQELAGETEAYIKQLEEAGKEKFVLTPEEQPSIMESLARIVGKVKGYTEKQIEDSVTNLKERNIPETEWVNQILSDAFNGHIATWRAFLRRGDIEKANVSRAELFEIEDTIKRMFPKLSEMVDAKFEVVKEATSEKQLEMLTKEKGQVKKALIQKALPKEEEIAAHPVSGQPKETKVDYPTLSNNIFIEGKSNNWQEFLDKYGTESESIRGYTLYDTRPSGMKVIVTPKGTVLFAKPVIIEDGWNAIREGFDVKGNWEWTEPAKPAPLTEGKAKIPVKITELEIMKRALLRKFSEVKANSVIKELGKRNEREGLAKAYNEKNVSAETREEIIAEMKGEEVEIKAPSKIEFAEEAANKELTEEVFRESKRKVTGTIAEVAKKLNLMAGLTIEDVSKIRKDFEAANMKDLQVMARWWMKQAGEHATNFKVWAQDMVKKYGDQIRPFLQKAWDGAIVIEKKAAPRHPNLTEKEFQAQINSTTRRLDISAEPLFRQSKSKSKALDDIQYTLRAIGDGEAYEIARQERVLEYINDYIEPEKRYKSYEEIPNDVAVYRGEQENTKQYKFDNFTLSRKVAEKFAGKEGIVKEFSIHKDNIKWINQYYMGHAEGEVFAFRKDLNRKAAPRKSLLTGRPTTEDAKTIKRVIQESKTADQLIPLFDEHPHPEWKAVATLLNRPHVIEQLKKVKIGEKSLDIDNNIEARSQANSQEIDFRFNKSQDAYSMLWDISHEIYHSLTLDKMETDKIFKNSMTEVFNKGKEHLTPEQIKEFKKVWEEDAVLADQTTQDIAYAFKNIHEFVSMALTSPAVQNFLRSIEYPKTEGFINNALKKFASLIHYAVTGEKMTQKKWTLYDETILRAEKIISASMKKGKGAKSFAPRKSFLKDEPESIFKEFARPTVDIMKDTAKGVDRYLGVISTRLAGIHETLRDRIKKHAFEETFSVKEGLDKIKDYYTKFEDLSDAHKLQLDKHLSNGRFDEAKKIFKGKGMEADFNRVVALLDDTIKRAIDSGMDIKYRENYFPRKLEDFEGFIEELDKETRNNIDKAIKEEAKKNGVSVDELGEETKGAIADTLLRGWSANKIYLFDPRYTKPREIEILTDRLLDYYAPSHEALQDYVIKMNHAIAMNNFFKKGRTKKLATVFDAMDIEVPHMGKFKESIGDVAQGLHLNNKQLSELKDILGDYFYPKVQGKYASGLRTLAYNAVLGNPITAMTQFQDVFLTASRHGVFNTLKAIGTKLTRQQTWGLTDIAVDHYMADFERRSKMGLAQKIIMKPMSIADVFGKEVNMNANYYKIRSGLRKGDAELNSEINRIFGDEAKQVKKDLMDGKKTFDTAFFMFSNLSKYHPISKAEVPQEFLRRTKGRFLYMLHTYQLKQLDVYRNDCLNEAKQGNYAKAIKNLVSLTGWLLAGSVSVNATRDFLLHGETRGIDEYLEDGAWQIVLVSRYLVDKGFREGIGTFLWSGVQPVVFSIANDISKDAQLLWKKALSDEEVEKGFRTIRYIPWVGKPYYDIAGEGVRSYERKLAKEESEE